MKSKTSAALLCVCAAVTTLFFGLTADTNAASRAPALPASGSITLDPDFNTPFFAVPNAGSRAVLLPDGKYVMFFNLDSLADQSTGPIIRFNSDGTLDTTFSFSHEYAGVGGGVAPTADGKLIIAATKTVYGVSSNVHQVYDILRLNSDGSIDPTFGPVQTTDGAEVRIITLNPDGTIFVGGRFTAVNGQPHYGIVRLLANGTLDPGFGPITMTCGAHPFGADGLCGLWGEPVIDGDGKIIIIGDFVSVNGVNAPGIARLDPDGTLDSTFNASGFQPFLFPDSPRPIRGAVIQSDGKIVIGGRLQTQANDFATIVPLLRLNTDGGVDENYGDLAFFPQPDGWFFIRNLLIQPDDKVIAISRSVWRFNSTDGSLDPTFNNPALLLQQQFDTEQGPAEAFNIAVTSEGGFFIGGSFTDIDDLNGPPGPERWAAAKLQPDGSLDTSFVTSHRVASKIEPGIFTREADGSTLIAFNSLGFISLFPAIPHNFGRLQSNGSLDNAYDPLAALNPSGPLGSNFLALGFAKLADGSSLVTGHGGNSASYGHLFANGSEDPNYNADPDVSFASAFPQSDGKVVLDGFYPNFSVYFADPSAQNAANGTQVQRINADGSADSSFQLDNSIRAATQQRDADGTLLSVYAGSAVLTVTVDGKILFGYVSSDSSYHLVRLNSDGSIDPSFTAVTFPVSLNLGFVAIIDPENPGAGYQYNVSVYRPADIPVKQARNVLDNKVVLMGSFASYGGDIAPGMVRINPDGTLDPAFSVGLGAQWTVTPEDDVHHPSIDNLEVGLDSKLLVTGTFEAFNNTPAPGIINLNPVGSVDPDFVAPVTRQKYDYQPAYLKRQADGSFLLSGPYSRPSDNFSPSMFRLLLPPGIETPPGDDVTVDAGSVGGANDVSVNFGAVNDGGSTSVAVIDPQWAGELPPGYELTGTELSFEIYTTSDYTPPVTICFDVSSLDDETFAAAQILHNDGTGLVDVTSSKDDVNKIICATVNSLSPFVVSPYNPATVILSATPTQTQEGSTAVYKFKMSMPLSQPLTITYATSGTATPGSDYTLTGTAGQITIPAGQTLGKIKLKALRDHVTEGTETVILTLQPGVGYELGRKSQATVSIVDSP